LWLEGAYDTRALAKVPRIANRAAWKAFEPSAGLGCKSTGFMHACLTTSQVDCIGRELATEAAFNFSNTESFRYSLLPRLRPLVYRPSRSIAPRHRSECAATRTSMLTFEAQPAIDDSPANGSLKERTFDLSDWSQR